MTRTSERRSCRARASAVSGGLEQAPAGRESGGGRASSHRGGRAEDGPQTPAAAAAGLAGTASRPSSTVSRSNKCAASSADALSSRAGLRRRFR